MSSTHAGLVPTSTRKVVEVAAAGIGDGRIAARVVALVVTFNRKEMVQRVLGSLSKQTYSRDLLSVVIIDNASTDGTSDALIEQLRPELIVENGAEDAAEPELRVVRGDLGPTAAATNSFGFASLVVVRNTRNHGGCGGFNTGFATVESLFSVGDRSAPFARPDRVWLVDDDADVAPDTLEQLCRAMDQDPDAGLVGSRTVDIADRTTTIETTIYFDAERGRMGDSPPAEHRLRAEHERWVQHLGGTKGARPFTGVREVDVVSACSMLARWSAVVGPRGDERDTRLTQRKPVGFWDRRFFIYCDDADWCLRFGRAGWKVILNLDAVVYHTPWLLKLTPARIYYAQRNAVWMSQKSLAGAALRSLTRMWLRTILKDSLRAGMQRRLFHGEIIRRTALDIVDQVAGKSGSDGPPALPIAKALREVGIIGAHAGSPTVLIINCQRDSLGWAARFRDQVLAASSGNAVPRFVLAVRNDVPGCESAGDGWAERIVYGPRLRSRLKRQLWLLRRRPHAVIVFEQTSDFPVLLGPLGGSSTLHIDLKNPDLAQIERDGWIRRLGFLARWTWAVVRCEWHALTVRPFTPNSRYG